MKKAVAYLVFIGILLVLPTAFSSAPDKEVTQQSVSEKGAFPAKVFVWCKWKQYQDRGAGERTIHFLVVSIGPHTLKWQIWDDHDGDGEWDWRGPFPPYEREWLFFPAHHYIDYASWSGYVPEPGCKPRTMVKYWIDDVFHSVVFEPDEW